MEKPPAVAQESGVTRWISAVKAGDEDAAAKIWERFFPKLVKMARKRMSPAARRVYDEEDAALSAFRSFFSDAKAGQYPKLDDRHDLWRLLTALTMHKIIDVRRAETTTKRGGGRVHGESDLDGSSANLGLDEFACPEPGPEFVVDLVDQARFVLDRLEPALRQIAVLKMSGLTNAEIADKVGVTCRSVERKLERVRRQWQEKV